MMGLTLVVELPLLRHTMTDEYHARIGTVRKCNEQSELKRFHDAGYRDLSKLSADVFHPDPFQRFDLVNRN